MAELRESLMALGKQAQKMRDKDSMGWFEIAQALEVPQGKAIAAYEVASWPESKVFKGTDAAVAKEIQRLRDKEGLSWARIAARVNISEAKCRTIYDPEGHGRGNRIGKGGRYPSDVEKPAPAAKTKAPAKKAAAKKVPASNGGGRKLTPKQVPIHKMKQDQITARLTNKVIKFEHGGRVRTIKVANVVNLSKPGGDLTVANAKGQEFTFNVAQDLVDAK